MATPPMVTSRQAAQCRPALGTFVKVYLRGDRSEDQLRRHIVEVFAEIERIERLMSFHDPASELSRINREAARRPVVVGPDLQRVLSFGLNLNRWTDGAYDLTVAPELVRRRLLPDPGAAVDPRAGGQDVELHANRILFRKPLLLDLGGIAKGYAVDRALAILPEDLEAVIDAGGDMIMRPWQGKTVSVRAPDSRRGELQDIGMWAPAVASSATCEDSQIVCARKRRTVNDRRGVSVFAQTCMVADAMTKVALLAPDSRQAWRLTGAQALVLDRRGRQQWLGAA